jgi:hypothetical protein
VVAFGTGIGLDGVNRPLDEIECILDQFNQVSIHECRVEYPATGNRARGVAIASTGLLEAGYGQKKSGAKRFKYTAYQ